MNGIPDAIWFAITRGEKESKLLMINIYESEDLNFFKNETGTPDDFPKVKELGYKTSYIMGEFQK